MSPIGVGLLTLVVGAAGGSPRWATWLDGLRLGEPPSAAVLDETTLIRASEARGLARGWVSTGLLAAINRAGALPAPVSPGERGSAMAEVRVSEGADGRWALALDNAGRLFAAYFVLPVPVDRSQDPPGAWSAARLNPLRRALGLLARYRLTATERDPRGNLFGWKGRTGGGLLRIEYRPRYDELRVLLYTPRRG